MSNPPPPPTIALLLNLVPDRPSSVLSALAAHPHLAPQQDQHGYSLLHAASSYGQPELLRALVRTYNVDVDTRDEDGQTALFAAETVAVGRCLVEELGADWRARDGEGCTAGEWVRREGEFAELQAYLASLEGGAAAQREGGDGPPPLGLPPNVQINVGTMTEPAAADGEAEGGPDPEFKRRIEELAARDDFQGEEGQAQLRELVTDAIRGVAADEGMEDGRSGARRRMG